MGSLVKGAVSAVGGAGPAAMLGSAVIGGVLQNYAGNKQAAAMREQAAAELQAGRMAAEEARFRPITVTTKFGTAAPQYNPQGFLSGYNYQASPELLARQAEIDRLMESSLGQASRAAAIQPQFEQAAQGLFSLGNSYLGQTPEEIRQRYMQQQMDVLRPYDIEEEQRLAASNMARGTGGLSVGAGGNPLYKALLESRNRRNLQLAAGAEEAAKQGITFGQGLFGQGASILGSGYQTQAASLDPFRTQFQTQQGLEEAARSGMDLGSALGAQASTAGKTSGAFLGQGLSNASQLISNAQQAKASGIASIGQGISGYGQQYNQYLQQQEQNQILRDFMNRSNPNNYIDPRTQAFQQAFLYGRNS